MTRLALVTLAAVTIAAAVSSCTSAATSRPRHDHQPDRYPGRRCARLGEPLRLVASTGRYRLRRPARRAANGWPACYVTLSAPGDLPSVVLAEAIFTIQFP